MNEECNRRRLTECEVLVNVWCLSFRLKVIKLSVASIDPASKESCVCMKFQPPFKPDQEDKGWESDICRH